MCWEYVSTPIWSMFVCRRRDGAIGFEDGTTAFLAIASLRHGFAAICRAGGFQTISDHVRAITQCARWLPGGLRSSSWQAANLLEGAAESLLRHFRLAEPDEGIRIMVDLSKTDNPSLVQVAANSHSTPIADNLESKAVDARALAIWQVHGLASGDAAARQWRPRVRPVRCAPDRAIAGAGAGRASGRQAARGGRRAGAGGGVQRDSRRRHLRWVQVRAGSASGFCQRLFSGHSFLQSMT